MKEFLAWVIGIGVSVALVIGVIWLFTQNDLAVTAKYAPKYEAVRRKTFVESQAFNEGVAKDLEDMERDYAKADHDGKDAIRTMVRRRTADYDLSQLPTDLRSFVEKMRGEN